MNKQLTNSPSHSVKKMIGILIAFTSVLIINLTGLFNSIPLFQIPTEVTLVRASHLELITVFFINVVLQIPHLNLNTTNQKLISFLKTLITSLLMSLLISSFSIRFIEETTPLFLSCVFWFLGITINLFVLPYAQLWIAGKNALKQHTLRTLNFWNNIFILCISLLISPITYLFIPPIALYLGPDSDTLIHIKHFLFFIIVCSVTLLLNSKPSITLMMMRTIALILNVFGIISTFILWLILLNFNSSTLPEEITVISFVFFTLFVLISLQVYLKPELFLSINSTKLNRTKRLLFVFKVLSLTMLFFCIVALFLSMHNIVSALNFYLFNVTLALFIVSIYALCFFYLIAISMINYAKSRAINHDSMRDTSLNTSDIPKNTNTNASFSTLLYINLKKYNDKINSTAIILFLLILTFLLSPVFSTSKFIANYHIDRMLNNKMTITDFKYFNFGVLGRPSETELLNLIERAKSTDLIQENVDALEAAVDLHVNYNGNETSKQLSDERNAVLEFYKDNLFKDITIIPEDHPISEEFMKQIRIDIHSREFGSYCQFTPKFPDNPITAKCYVLALALNEKSPEEYVYAIIKIADFAEDFSHHIQFVKFVDNDLKWLDFGKLTECQLNDRISVNQTTELDEFRDDIIKTFRAFESSTFAFVWGDALTTLNPECELFTN